MNTALPTALYQPPAHEGLAVLQVSRHLLILDKPAGLLTVPGRGEDKADCLLTRAQLEFPDAMIVHRLDRDTSGIVVLARGPKFQRALSMLFQDRAIQKRYTALVDGVWTAPATGEINQPLIVDWPNRPRQKIDHAEGRPSLTRYRLIDTDIAQEISRLELEPVTGRTHQLRVHLESTGHPILGDLLYGTEQSRSKAPRLLLHACFIEFSHPETSKLIRIESKPPF